ncbi:MAG: ribosome small subunit-dependent GTPase [Pseudomonadota bacterium]|jgi:ribosome biogenesis GTPase
MNSNESNMNIWGWKDFFAQQVTTESPDQIARVIKEQRDHLLLIDGTGRMIGGIISGNWKKRRDDFENPSVGDWVIVDDKTNDRDGISFYRIKQRLNRFSQILRKAAGPSEKSQLLAANVDVAFLVQSSNQDLDVRRLERYLSLLGDGEIKPIIVLTKCDLPNTEKSEKELSERFPAIPLLMTRSDQPNSIKLLEQYLGLGITSVFLGSSGVGKSTLTNLLLEAEAQLVQDIRKNDSKGRHTTTGRSMFLLESQRGLVIDTPGLREVKLPQNESNVEEAFSEILELSLKCRFANCLHKTEPQCAVKEAVKQGLLSQDKLTHYQKLKEETKKNLYSKK